MKTKIEDAWNEIKKERREEQEQWRQLRPKLREKRKEEAYNDIWKEEKDRYFRKLRKKRKEKVEWIEKKYYKKKELRDEINGVVVKDQILDDSFTTEAITYGNVEISEDEKRVLEMHPKYTVFEKVDPIDNEAEVEKALTKIRWARREEERKNNENNDGNNDNNGRENRTRPNEPDPHPQRTDEMAIQQEGGNENESEEGRRGDDQTTTTNKKETYDIEGRKFDFRYSRSTELPFNIRTIVPGPMENKEEEIRLQSLKIELTGIIEQYAKEKETEMENLSAEQKRGLKSLRKKQKDEQIVIFQTDKSGKMSIDTPENYIEAARPHIEKDTIITEKEYEDIEKLVNAHSAFWVNMLKVGEKSGDTERYKSSMKTENSKASTLYMYRKDHKPHEDREKGPPVRPLCDVSDSYGHKLSYFVSNILKEVTDKEPTVCDSTEDMMANIKEANDSRKIKKGTVIGSLDVKALYPSLDLDFTIEKAAEEFHESGVEIEGIDYEELGLYLSLHKDVEYLREKEIDQHCPKRKGRGPAPTITGSGAKAKKEDRFHPWNKPTIQPDETKQRVMLTEALKIVLTTLMKNHVYDFKNELRKQKEGGAIGVDLTGELAKVFMTWWDKELLKKLEEIGIRPIMYKRYVDDIVIIVIAIEGEENEENENELEPDERTFRKIKEVGDSIHRSIQLTKEVPTEKEDKKLPVLDLKSWIEEVEEEGEKRYMVLHEFYMKDVASRALIHRDAALSLSCKRTILTQQCIRVMRNCHEKIGKEKQTEHLTYYSARMQAAGYDQEFRIQVMESAFKAFEAMKEEARIGRKPVYRKREWKRNERRREKIRKSKNWYKKGGKESVLFVTATPGSELKNKLQKEIEKSTFKIKVVEKSGNKIIRLLQKNNPFKKDKCGKENCMICAGNGKGSCRETDITYKIECLGSTEQEEKCEGVYNGETGRNGYTRGAKHLELYEKEQENSAMWKHCVQKHSSRRQGFKMTVQDRVRGDPTKRQILEAIRMSRTKEEDRMNSRAEWKSNRIPRINVTRD